MPRTGRPRTFDRAQAVQRAMELFWALGYEATTLNDLQDVMGGITAPSFYAAFGSKEKLFREVVDLYRQTEGDPMLKALTQITTARASIDGLLRAVAESFCRCGTARGCLIVLSTINCMPENRSVQEYMRQQRLLRRKIIRERLQRGVAEGDLPAGLDLNGLANFYAAVISGMAIEARDGASRKAMQTTVDCAMAAWDKFVGDSPQRHKGHEERKIKQEGIKGHKDGIFKVE